VRRVAKWTLITLLGCVAIFSLFWMYFSYRRQAIAGDWTDPVVEFCEVRHSTNSDQSVFLIHYYYTVSQTAKLKHPFYVWKDTAWERRIDERHHSIARGYGVSIVESGKVFTFPVGNAIDQVLWSDAIALCIIGNGWLSVDGSEREVLPASFIPPSGLTNSLSEKELMVPTSAERHPAIATLIRDQNLGDREGRNYYKPK
jgi:hypothetical protein